MTEIGVLNVIVNAGAFGLLAWMAVYWLPRVSSGYSATVERMSQAHEKEMSAAIEVFRSEQKYEREQCQRQFSVILEAVQQTQTTLSKTLEEQSRMILQHHKFAEQSIGAFRSLGEKAADAVAKASDSGARLPRPKGPDG